MKKRLGPQTRLYPMPVPLVLSGTGDDANMLACAWITIAGSKPPAIAMVIGRNHHTMDLIRQTGEFTVNFASTKHVTEVDFCGIAHGTEWDKFERTGLTQTPSAVIDTPLITECPYNLECRLIETIDLPTGSNLVLGEIVESHADEDVLDESGINVAVEKLDPLAYITGVREYWSMGEKIADAYSVGKALKE